MGAFLQIRDFRGIVVGNLWTPEIHLVSKRSMPLNLLAEAQREKKLVQMLTPLQRS